LHRKANQQPRRRLRQRKKQPKDLRVELVQNESFAAANKLKQLEPHLFEEVSPDIRSPLTETAMG
jgi:hypothetical protein